MYEKNTIALKKYSFHFSLSNRWLHSYMLLLTLDRIYIWPITVLHLDCYDTFPMLRERSALEQSLLYVLAYNTYVSVHFPSADCQRPATCDSPNVFCDALRIWFGLRKMSILCGFYRNGCICDNLLHSKKNILLGQQCYIYIHRLYPPLKHWWIYNSNSILQLKHYLKSISIII